MGLRESRILATVHPYLAARLEWLDKVAKIYGSSQALISGWRTNAEQYELWKNQTTRPAAFPGCSQHNYGYAADARWTPAVVISSKGRPLIYSQAETDRTMGNFARQVGLHLVSNDTGHLQVYNGLVFKEWATAWGWCPDPGLSRGGTSRFSMFQRENARGRTILQICGPQQGGFVCDVF